MMKRALILFVCLFSAGSSNAQSLWEWQNPLPQGNVLSDICFVDSLRGWAVGGAGTVLRTTDSGSTWQTKGFDQILSDVYYSDVRTGWVADIDGVIHRTTNAGATWTKLDGRSTRGRLSSMSSGNHPTSG